MTLDNDNETTRWCRHFNTKLSLTERWARTSQQKKNLCCENCYITSSIVLWHCPNDFASRNMINFKWYYSVLFMWRWCYSLFHSRFLIMCVERMIFRPFHLQTAGMHTMSETIKQSRSDTHFPALSSAERELFAFLSRWGFLFIYLMFILSQLIKCSWKSKQLLFVILNIYARINGHKWFFVWVSPHKSWKSE